MLSLALKTTFQRTPSYCIISLVLATSVVPSVPLHASAKPGSSVLALPVSFINKYLWPVADAGKPLTVPGPFDCGSTIAFTASNVFCGIVSTSTVKSKNLSSVGSCDTVPTIIVLSYGLSRRT